jgi:hypothetical protein
MESNSSPLRLILQLTIIFFQDRRGKIYIYIYAPKTAIHERLLDVFEVVIAIAV